MSGITNISWAERVWNPVLGCSKESPGCTNCYAIDQAWIKQHNPNPKIAAAYAGLVYKRVDGSRNWTGRLNVLPERLPEPLSWKQPSVIFVNSMSDLFHEDVPDDFLARCFEVMATAHWHTFLVLTKRPERMRAFVEQLLAPLDNVWLGTSTEDQQRADQRVPILLDIRDRAPVLFLSIEPQLGPVRLDRWLGKLDWIIGGGESGPRHRPFHLGWARLLRDQCEAASVAFHFKQVGGVRHADGGCLLDGREWKEFPTPRPHHWAQRELFA